MKTDNSKTIMDRKTQPEKKPDDAKSQVSTIEWWLKFVALVGAIVSLLGYGVVTGLASAMNLDHGSMLGGPFELLSLVWPGVLLMLTAIDKIDFMSVLSQSFSQALPVALAAFLVVVLTSVFMRYKSRVPKIDWAWFKAKVIPNENETILTTFRKAAFLAISSVTAVALATLAGFIGVFAVLICLLTVPIIGFSAGRAYFNEYVLKPKQCVSVVPGDVRLKARKNPDSETGVVCALVRSVDKDKAYKSYGRVVLSSPNYMLMYHFDTGVGERIPVAGLVIQSIDDAGIAALDAGDTSHSENDIHRDPKGRPPRLDGPSS